MCFSPQADVGGCVLICAIGVDAVRQSIETEGEAVLAVEHRPQTMFTWHQIGS